MLHLPVIILSAKKILFDVYRINLHYKKINYLIVSKEKIDRFL